MDFSLKMKTKKFGVDKLELMVEFMHIFEAEGKTEAEKQIGNIKLFIETQIKRLITPQENIDLMQGVVNYLQSEPGTKARTSAMDYLFELNFLNE